MKAKVYVSSFSRGIVGPAVEVFDHVKDGGSIVANTAPGCWGPMITPIFKGGHEVTKPVAVENANIGDALAIYIKSIKVTSMATSSGVMAPEDTKYKSDPFVDRYCPSCGTENPPTKLVGIGANSVRCAICGAEVSPFKFANGYTMMFDNESNLGITVNRSKAEELAQDAENVMKLPHNSEQNPIVIMCPADIEGIVTRIRPFIGNIGTTPPINMPDSHNAGDFGQFLIGASHEYALTKEQLELRTDSHMDINIVREGAILICPVKVEGGGIFIGDVHAMQGDGEVAGHTTDVSAEIEITVKVIKGLSLEGPIIFPIAEDLPLLAKPFTKKDKDNIYKLSKKFNQIIPEMLPIQFVGSGANLNDAFDNAMERASNMLNYEKEKILNLATIAGSVQIGRLPGIIRLTIMAEKEKFEDLNLYEIAKKQYG